MKKIKKLKNKKLEDNLKKNLHSQTYNSLFDDIKLRLNNEISDHEFETLLNKYE